MEQRSGDLILAQGSYILVQDGASGQVEVLVGPLKQSLADTDKPVVYDHKGRRYLLAPAEEAKRVCPVADEGQYLVLTNPESTTNEHPTKGKHGLSATGLGIGHKINIPGPCTFPLWPGQFCETIDGHQLKSNEYLLIRVYNDKAAKDNLSSAIIKTADTKENKKTLIKEEDLVTGKLLIIKGTDVSFYIPPTGIEVLKDSNGKYVRNAVTLESLEYCILLDQNGVKRYVEGPSVVFPKPTETFIEQNSTTKFKALELNDNMGIYIKVIADYEDGKNKYKAGDELFIKGKETKIYFPRAEHAIVRYGKDMIHYAVAIPRGEGRYVLNKDTGEVQLKNGPSMFLPDPRKEVIVKRIIDEKYVELWFPGNDNALSYNRILAKEKGALNFLTVDEQAYTSSARMTKSTSAVSAVADEMQRSSTYTKPRTITLDTKYDGAVTINVWPGYAVQVVKKTGERIVEQGPKTILLDYDETLETLELSTGKPKSDNTLLKTVYLLTQNNIVSDIAKVVTKDLVEVEIRLTYRVNFVEDPSKWFSVSNYVKLLTQHMRSVIRNYVKKLTIEEFNDNATDLLRNVILGESTEDKKRTGKYFKENGMVIYDVEILDLNIKDEKIKLMLEDTQHRIVQHNLEMKKKEKELEYVTSTEISTRKILQEYSDTEKVKSAIELQKVQNSNIISNKILSHEFEKQDNLNKIATENLNRKTNELETINGIELKRQKEESDIRVNEVKEKNGSIQPQLVEAMLTLGQINNNKILAENLKAQGGGLQGIFQKGGIDGLLETVKGTPLEESIKNFFDLEKKKKPSEKK